MTLFCISFLFISPKRMQCNVYTILVSPRTYYYNCVTPRATGAAALKPKITSKEHRPCRLRCLSVRLSGHLAVWSYLPYLYSGCTLFFFIIFAFFVENHLLGNTKLSFLVLWFKSYRPCRQRALYFSLCLHSLLKITY